jgi:hypothetical protein
MAGMSSKNHIEINCEREVKTEDSLQEFRFLFDREYKYHTHECLSPPAAKADGWTSFVRHKRLNKKR